MVVELHRARWGGEERRGEREEGDGSRRRGRGRNSGGGRGRVQVAGARLALWRGFVLCGRETGLRLSPGGPCWIEAQRAVASRVAMAMCF